MSIALPPWLPPALVAALAASVVTWLAMRLAGSGHARRERLDALSRARATLRGQVVEQLAPMLPDFPYPAEDARFLGAPIDYVVFSGLGDEDEDVEIVFLEVKTGGARLSPREQRIREAVRAGRVRFETLRLS